MKDLNDLSAFMASLRDLLNLDRDQPHVHCCGFSLDPKQKQSGCGHQWTHKMSDFSDQEGYDQGHICPKCGKGPWRWKLDEETLREHDERRASGEL
jgi:hypothetical protein